MAFYSLKRSSRDLNNNTFFSIYNANLSRLSAVIVSNLNRCEVVLFAYRFKALTEVIFTCLAAHAQEESHQSVLTLEHPQIKLSTRLPSDVR